jgi:transcription initiation factor IIF auxiliary subunit
LSSGGGNIVKIVHTLEDVPNSYPRRRDVLKYRKWTVLVKGSPTDLANINHVEYHLHPTFPKPVVESNDRKNGFAYSSAAWGSFRMGYKFYLTNGKIIEGDYDLDLNKNGESDPIQLV